ncbi:MAG: calcium-binding protein [Ferruginibacter sp.]|uniref:c-type cytochrome n=1 Tax=Ferruginibacter sp. TaxID=1940288 RepID=UPI0026583D66|nr:cytochrome c [Ferruginibacter sp.]MDB5276216.1 calcium-binding protein [Ferruginibacter sp.]
MAAESMITKMKNFVYLVLFLLNSSILQAQQLTYYNDIAPIVQTKCAPCHHPGGGAPFSLLGYEDVSKRVSFIKEVVQSGYMPPWKADNSYVHFANDRSLSQKEISLLVQWIDNKAPQGTKVKQVAATPEFTSFTTYSRKPDLVLKMADSFLVRGDNKERFAIFKIPFELKDAENIEAIEFYSNNKKLIHHANYAIHDVADTSINIYKTDATVNLSEDDHTKLDQYRLYKKVMTYYGGWIPGTTYEYYPKEFGWIMPKRGVILLTVHFAPSAVDEKSFSQVNLFFKKTPVTRQVKVISFGSGGIGEKQITPIFYIKANEKKSFTLEVTNPGTDVSIMYVWPHMHYIGKSFKAYLVSQEGDTSKLVSIPEWDFRWQEIYRLKHLLKVPKGSVMHIEGTYDNTAENPANPRNPPRTVFSESSMISTDEMLTLLMVYLPYEEGDEKKELE